MNRGWHPTSGSERRQGAAAMAGSGGGAGRAVFIEARSTTMRQWTHVAPK